MLCYFNIYICYQEYSTLASDWLVAQPQANKKVPLENRSNSHRFRHGYFPRNWGPEQVNGLNGGLRLFSSSYQYRIVRNRFSPDVVSPTYYTWPLYVATGCAERSGKTAGQPKSNDCACTLWFPELNTCVYGSYTCFSWYPCTWHLEILMVLWWQQGLKMFLSNVQGWLKVIGFFMFQLATNMVLGYRTWNLSDVLSMI